MVKLKTSKTSNSDEVKKNALSTVKNRIFKKSKPMLQPDIIKSMGILLKPLDNSLSNSTNIIKGTIAPAPLSGQGKQSKGKKKSNMRKKPVELSTSIDKIPSISNSSSITNSDIPIDKQAKKRAFIKTFNEGQSGKKKKVKKNSAIDNEDDDEAAAALPLTRSSDEPIPKKIKWKNRQRVLVFCCRGIGNRDRHLLKDLRRLLPHSRPDSKMERRENLSIVNDLCAMKNCNKCILIEGRANRDVYMWLSCVPGGPSVKFFLQNIYTMDELKFTGNCLIGSRPLLSFDETFETVLHYRLIKEIIIQVFSTPKHHPKSQPFYDHVFTFSILDNRIWFRNYQILSEDGGLVEIGPRFIMNPVKIFENSFGGATIWENRHYVTPAKLRQLVRKGSAGAYVNRVNRRTERKFKEPELSYKLPVTNEVFTENPWETAKNLISKNQISKKAKDAMKSKNLMSEKSEEGGSLKHEKKKKKKLWKKNKEKKSGAGFGAA